MNFMVDVGFNKGTTSHWCFYHKERNFRCVVHGDDFTVLDTEKKWIGTGIESKNSNQ